MALEFKSKLSKSQSIYCIWYTIITRDEIVIKNVFEIGKENNFLTCFLYGNEFLI